MNLMDAKLQASRLFPEFNNPEAITSEGLVRIYGTSFCSRQDNNFTVYVDGEVLGESSLSPNGAWEDAAQNLPTQFLDQFTLEFSETGVYYMKENDEREREVNSYTTVHDRQDGECNREGAVPSRT